eukprot:GSChrysophyteH1.ASY1.ANO1.2177.1 assembled CDS
MSRVQWRKFAFFDKDIVAEKIDAGLDSVPTCSCAEGGMLIFGDANGNIFIADNDLQRNQQKFKAFRGEVKAISYLFDPTNHRRQFVVAVGDDSRPRIAADGKVIPTITSQYVVKAFNMNDLTRPMNAFLASPGVDANAILTSFAVMPDGSQIAVGFSNRTVLLFSGAFLKEGTILRQIQPEVVLPSRAAVMPITGLHFCEISLNSVKKSTDKIRRTRLFVVIDIDSAYPGTGDVMTLAEGGVLLLDTSVRISENASGAKVATPLQNRKPMNILDERGAGKNCTSLMHDICELLVGRAEGVFSYSMDDRGGAAGFEGDKQCIRTVGRYVLVGSTDLKTRKTSITIYDLRNKFISMHSQLPAGERILSVLNDGGAAYIITSSYTLLRFREKDTQAKLDVLLRKALYPLAISLAAEEQCEVTEIMKLYRAYGDHLYKKEEFESSVQQYCHTIGFLPPSYVIRRFLDPHRVVHLVQYLEKLQERGLANNDHAVLLLTCYTKMEQLDKVVRYIHTFPSENATKDWSSSLSLTEEQLKEFSNASGFVNFDPEASVEILKNAYMIEEALVLAQQCSNHSLTMELLMDRAVTEEGIQAVIAYLMELVVSVHSDELLPIINTHGPRLLRLQPDVITALFVRLVTGDLDKVNAPSSSSSKPISVDDLISVFVDNTGQLQIFLDSVLESRRNTQGMPLPPLASETLLELHLQDYKNARDHLNELLPTKKKSEISAAKKVEKALEKKILILLDGHLTDTYEPSQALLLVHTYGCEAASRFLLDRMQSTELLMQQHMEIGDERGIFKVLRREGRKDTELYVQVLSYFVRQAMEEPGADEDEDERWDAVSEVLRLIETEGVLSPMQIVHVVSQHPTLPLSVVSKYVERAIKVAYEDIEMLEQNVDSTTQSLNMLLSGETRNRVLSAASSTGHSAASSPSPTRMLHGSANNSNDDDDDDDDDGLSQGSASVSSKERQLLEQQENTTEKEKWIRIKSLAKRRSTDHESFFAEIEGSEDGFSTVAAAFGKTLVKSDS